MCDGFVLNVPHKVKRTDTQEGDEDEFFDAYESDSIDEEFDDPMGNENLDTEVNYHGDMIEDAISENSDESEDDMEMIPTAEDVSTGGVVEDSAMCGDNPTHVESQSVIEGGRFAVGTCFSSIGLDRGIMVHDTSQKFKDSLTLMKTLRDERVPLNMYNKMSEWHKTTKEEVSASAGSLLTRKALMSEIHTMFPDLPKYHVPIYRNIMCTMWNLTQDGKVT